MKSEAAIFWDNKILQWEKDKYSNKNLVLNYFDVNSSIKSRLKLARKILKDIVPGRTVLELGCGSALLMEDILSFGAQKYIGVDISEVAINAAKKRISKNEISSRAELHVKNISELNSQNVDICFSLGLLDWLSLDEIHNLNSKIKTDFFFHTFSEKKQFSPSQILHKIYVYLMYGYKKNNYVPLYHLENEIIAALGLNTASGNNLLRHPNLSFGCLVYNLPSPIGIL